MDEQRQKTVKRLITIFTIIVLVPSIYLAGDVVKEAAFNAQSSKFANDFQEDPSFENTQLLKMDKDYHHRSQTITLSLMGSPLTNTEITNLQHELQTEYGLKQTKLIVKQTGQAIDITKQNEIIEDIINKKDATIAQQDSTINDLRSKINKIQNAETLSIQLAKEINTQYPDVAEFAITDLVQYNTKTLDNKTIAVVYLKWKDKNYASEEEQLLKWLYL